MHEHVGKHSKMHKSEESQTGGIKQERQAYKHRMEWRKVCINDTNTTEVYLTSGYTLGGMDVTTQANPQGAQSMAKPRSR